MALLHCRQCNSEIVSDSIDCPKCQCHYPFNCAVCGEATGMLSEIGWSYPFTASGHALCSKHSQRLCDTCHKPFPSETLTQRTARWEYITTTNEYIMVPGAYCSHCLPSHVEPVMPAKHTRRAGCGSKVLLGIFLLPLLCLLSLRTK